MGIFDFKKPKWRHKDPEVRLASIGSIDPSETAVLAELSKEDQNREVRQAAINKLSDLATLHQLAKDAADEDLPVIISRLDCLLFDQIINCRDTEKWRDNLDQITSPELLEKLAVNASLPDVRLAAVNRIDDQQLLAEIVKQNCGKNPAQAALAKITDEGLLADLCKSAANKTARRLATDKIAEIEQQRNPASNQEITRQKLNALIAEAAELQANPIIDAAALKLAALRQEWTELDSENKHPAYQEFNKICTDFEDQYNEILNRRKIEQEKVTRYERFWARLDEICSIIEGLCCSIENDAEAVKRKAEADWTTLVNDPKQEMVASATLTKRFNNACRAFETNREKINLEKPLFEAIEQKCAEARELIATQDLKKAATLLGEAEKSLELTKFNYFSKAVIEKLVSDTSSELRHAETAVRTQNLSRRQELLTELEKLAQIDNRTRLETQLQSLKQDWQQLAKFDDAESNELEQRFQKSAAELTEKLKTLEHEQDWQLWANLTLKEKLTEQVVALDSEENLETVFNVIKESQLEWKKIGPVPHKESQRLWDEFQNACNRNFERAIPYLELQKTERAEAMDRRREICKEAAELAESQDWQKTALAIKGLQEEWKTLAHGSRREEQKLYQQFREACDRFFTRRQEHYNIQDEKRGNNLVAKIKLCEEAERLAAAPQIDHPKLFKRLQSEWKRTGPAPRKEENAIWQRFRAACDMYFNWLAAEQQRNLQQKEELCEAAEKILAQSATDDNKKELATSLTELQRQWKEIGPVPPDRSEAVWQRFRKACDSFFAARQEEYEQEMEERRLNQSRKEEILASAEDIAGRNKDQQTGEQLKLLQKKWFEIGPAPREINKELNERFKNLCDAFFENRRQYFIDLQTQQMENQKKKEGLCLRLENLLGLSTKTGAKEKGKALSLAEELKLAMEDNFMLAGRRNEQKEINDEVRRIEQEWEKTGHVPPRQIRPLTERYKKALDAFYKSRRA